MKYLKVSPIILFFFAVFTSKAQNNKGLAFKKFVFVTYDVSGSGKNKHIAINDYIEINDGTVHRQTKYYKGVSDTSYMLPEKFISSVNSIFNGQKDLKSYLNIKKLPPGRFGGEPYFFSYTDLNGRTQNFIAVDIYMNSEFMKVFDLLTRLPASYYTLKYKADKVRDDKMEATVLKYHNACTYLPDMSDPPPAKM